MLQQTAADISATIDKRKANQKEEIIIFFVKQKI